MKKPVAVDLFCGAGGATLGMKMAGFNVIAANEINPDAAETYKYNNPETILFNKDVRELTGTELRKVTGKKVDLLFAGIPCQGFSMAGRRDPDDPRNYLFKEALKLIHAVKPKHVLFENVGGLSSMKGGEFLASMRDGLGKRYLVSDRIFDARDFGVPQSRKRIFILGTTTTSLTLKDMKLPKTRAPPVKEAIGDLDFLDSGEECGTYKKPASSAYQRKMRKKQKILWNHKASRHCERIMTRFSCMLPGQTNKSLPLKLRTKKRYQYRLDGSRCAPTITTLPDDYIHYSKARILTVRENARLQSFPDSYRFLGVRTTGNSARKSSCPQFSQVGNSVPPLMMRHIAGWLIQRTDPKV